MNTPGVTAPPGSALYYRQRYAANKERYSAASGERQLRKKLAEFGITWEHYQYLLALGCASCGALTSGKNRLHLDHDHETGKFRGLLCSNCNTALGLVGDDMERLAQLIAYLARSQACR